MCIKSMQFSIIRLGGIKKIYYMRNYHNDDYAIRLLKRKKVAVEQVKVEPKYLNTVSINIAEN